MSSAPPRQSAGTAKYVLMAAVGGAAAATSGRVQGTLSAQMNDPFLAAIFSVFGAMLAIAIALAFSPKSRAGFHRVGRAALDSWRNRRVDGELAAAPSALSTGDEFTIPAPKFHWWQCLGGIVGTFFVLSQGVAIGTLGVAMFVVAIIAGNSVGSLLVDHKGIGPGGVHRISLMRVIGPALAVLAASIGVWGQVHEHHGTWLIVLPLLVGFAQAWQQAVNGHVRGLASSLPDGNKSPLAGIVVTSLFNFYISAIGVVLAFVVVILVRGWQHETLPTNPLLYVSGLLALINVALAATVVARIGVLLLGLGNIAGQMIAAMLLDLGAGYAIDPTTFVAVALILAAVAVPVISHQRARR